MYTVKSSLRKSVVQKTEFSVSNQKYAWYCFKNVHKLFTKTETVGYKSLIRECINTKAKYVTESNLYSKQNPLVEEHRKQRFKAIHASDDVNLYSFYFYFTFAYFTFAFSLANDSDSYPNQGKNFSFCGCYFKRNELSCHA